MSAACVYIGEELARYVADGDVASLTRLPGIGKKTAERIIVELRDKLEANTRLFRRGMNERGFQITPGEHPICPIMLGDAALAVRMADALLRRGVYVIGFSYPVVPKGQARIRTQMSAGLSHAQLDAAVEAFTTVGRELAVID